MGEARRRGSYEERKQKAIALSEQQQKQKALLPDPPSKPISRGALAVLAIAAAALARHD